VTGSDIFFFSFLIKNGKIITQIIIKYYCFAYFYCEIIDTEWRQQKPFYSRVRENETKEADMNLQKLTNVNSIKIRTFSSVFNR